MLGLSFASATAKASVITDIPSDLAESLDISVGLAGMILSMAMIVSLVLVLAVAEMPPIGIIVPVIALMILLTVMEWLDPVVIIFTAIVTAIYFGMTISGLWGTPGS